MRQTNLIDVYQPFISHKTLIEVLVISNSNKKQQISIINLLVQGNLVWTSLKSYRNQVKNINNLECYRRLSRSLYFMSDYLRYIQLNQILVPAYQKDAQNIKILNNTQQKLNQLQFMIIQA
ncbi:hypothetical protein pb186bvf_004772 [Paramecium bursaria]